MKRRVVVLALLVILTLIVVGILQWPAKSRPTIYWGEWEWGYDDQRFSFWLAPGPNKPYWWQSRMLVRQGWEELSWYPAEQAKVFDKKLYKGLEIEKNPIQIFLEDSEASYRVMCQVVAPDTLKIYSVSNGVPFIKRPPGYGDYHLSGDYFVGRKIIYQGKRGLKKPW